MHRTNTLIVALCMALTVGACASRGPVTVENSPEGKIAVHALKVVQTNKEISTAVMRLADSNIIAKDKAAIVIQNSIKLDTYAIQLADLLKAYDSMTPGAPSPAATSKFEEIRAKVSEMGALVSVLLVPIADEGARGQIANLVSALNSTLLTISFELQQGVR